MPCCTKTKLLTCLLGLGLAVCLLLGGCGAIRTLYGQADHVAAWRVDDYFDLTDEQKRLFRTRFQSLHAWHRSTQLRDYASLLEAAESRLDRGPVLQDWAWAMQEMRSRWHALLAHATPDIASFLATLSDQQIAAARRRFDRDNRKFAKEHGVGAPPEEQRRLRDKIELERIEHWTGSLDRQQQARISALSSALPLDAWARHQDRMRRQREFLALLETRKEPERFAERLRNWLLDWDENRPPQLRAELERYADAHARMFLHVHAELRPEQRRKVHERLRWYIDLMRDMAKEARS
ncbi:MAG: hypothetical protein IT531_15120 [Burkholderiales bacterium]|nr:hypothetical protein [Burkholderiales bacterium]